MTVSRAAERAIRGCGSRNSIPKLCDDSLIIYGVWSRASTNDLQTHAAGAEPPLIKRTTSSVTPGIFCKSYGDNSEKIMYPYRKSLYILNHSQVNSTKFATVRLCVIEIGLINVFGLNSSYHNAVIFVDIQNVFAHLKNSHKLKHISPR